MSELKYFFSTDGEVCTMPAVNDFVCLKSEADKVIAEKDAEIALLKERICNGDVSRLTWIDDCIAKDKEIAELKAKLHDAEMRADLAEAAETERKIDYDNLNKNLAYHARQIYFKHNRQTLRALWLARALRARDIQRWWIATTCAPKTERACSVWNNVEHKCRAKAEEYK